MSEDKIERFFCNICKGKTKHFIRAAHEKHDDDGEAPTNYHLSYHQRFLIAECCGCEHLALVKKTHFSEDVNYG